LDEGSREMPFTGAEEASCKMVNLQ